MQNSKITKEEQRDNPEAVIDALKFYDKNIKQDDKFMNFNKQPTRKGSSSPNYR